MQLWFTWYRAPNGSITRVTAMADTSYEARMILEGQYGAANLTGLPCPV